MLCRKICDLESNIVGVWIFRLKNLLASEVKPEFAEPAPQEQEDMFVQAQLMVSFANSHQDIYGKVKYILVSFEHFDAILIATGQEEILAVGCVKPYSLSEITKSIDKIAGVHQLSNLDKLKSE